MTANEHPDPAIDALAAAALHDAGIPGLAVAVATARSTVLLRAYGSADVGSGRNVTPDTRFMLGSAAKPFVATVIGALVDREMLDLDADIERWLDFRVRHPAFADTPISLRLLLAHRAGIRDDLDAMRAAMTHGDSPVGLGVWLRERFADPRAFTSDQPGTSELYTNTGWALAAFVAERAADTDFAELCLALLFQPLGIHRAGWRLGESDPNELARPHDGGLGEPLRAVAHYGYPDYPSGSLRIGAAELARFLSFVVGRGRFEGRTLVGAPWMEAMEQGLGWQSRDGGFGHDGLDRGVGTRIVVSRAHGCGIAILGNAAWTHPSPRADALALLEARLFEIGAEAR